MSLYFHVINPPDFKAEVEQLPGYCSTGYSQILETNLAFEVDNFLHHILYDMICLIVV